ncbi:unnamed protein product [Periconia digitata]|uniref:Uncharacterized protein n=1 Tax=Periconia digitata TaxID=1303443 RepID=A0A9W4XZD0_9PLEO|nr:unnamed protein product [Periconia digitata]
MPGYGAGGFRNTGKGKSKAIEPEDLDDPYRVSISSSHCEINSENTHLRKTPAYPPPTPVPIARTRSQGLPLYRNPIQPAGPGGVFHDCRYRIQRETRIPTHADPASCQRR